MGTLVQPVRFDFEHPAFGRAGAHFAVSTYREIVFRVALGELDASLDLDQVAGTLGLSFDSPDRRLLKLVPAAMRYRRRLRSGDTLPSETIDASPSWSPKPHLVVRAVGRIGQAIGAADMLAEPAPPAEMMMSAALDGLARVVRDKMNPRALDLSAGDVAQIALDTARVDWLCRTVIDLQQALGGIVKLAGPRQNTPRAERARAVAHGLRDAVVWASERAMALDTIVADPLRVFGNVPDFRKRLWPAMAGLRAFLLDIEPLLVAWNEARERRGGPTDPDLETLQRLVTARYLPFEAGYFAWRRIEADLLVPAGGRGKADDAMGAITNE
jgi:hypothetical protein